MHDHLIIAAESSIVFSMMSIYLVTFHTHFFINKLVWTAISALISMYFIDGWRHWEIWMMMGDAVITAISFSKTCKRSSIPLNNVELVLIGIVQPLYVIILFPIIIPQTNVAVGVQLAFVLWCPIVLFFSIFYNEHQHTLDVRLIITGITVFISTLFFHHWKWVPPALSLGIPFIYNTFFVK
jgi:hypothetical protein